MTKLGQIIWGHIYNKTIFSKITKTMRPGYNLKNLCSGHSMKLDAQKVILLYFLSLWRVDQEIIVVAIKQIVLQLLIEQYFKHCVHHWHKLHFIIARRLDFCVFHQYHYSNFVTKFSPAEVYPQGSWSSVEACST